MYSILRQISAQTADSLLKRKVHLTLSPFGPAGPAGPEGPSVPCKEQRCHGEFTSLYYTAALSKIISKQVADGKQQSYLASTFIQCSHLV